MSAENCYDGKINRDGRNKYGGAMRDMRVLILVLAGVVSWLGVGRSEPIAARPKITGIAFVRVYASDVAKSRDFYARTASLGSSPSACSDMAQACFVINDHQQLEIVPASGSAQKNLLAEIAFATDDVSAMRLFLTAHGVAATEITKDRNGAEHFETRDPEDHPIAFVERKKSYAFSPAPEQLTTRMFHAGFVVRDSAKENRFYRDLLGFRMYWHGGFKDTDTDWEEIQVPDGGDWIEYMLNIPATADKRELGVQNHFSFGVVSMKPAFEKLKERGLKEDGAPEIGRDGKWGFDVYDPDGTRVEFMEFQPAQKPCCNEYSAPHPTP